MGGSDEEVPCTDEGQRRQPPAEPEAPPTEQSAAEAFPAEECLICFEVMNDACPVRKLACGHRFHHSCIQRWLQQDASCPLCKAVVQAPGCRDGSSFKVDLGHQEMAQIMTELEDIFLAVHACAGPERPVALNGLAYNLCVSLGYEDEDELEEAIGGTLADFLTALPHFNVVWPEEDAVTQEPRATMLPEPSADGDADRPGRLLRFTVSGRNDLFRVVMQGPQCVIDIPELEFAIRPKAKRRVDTIYNMIASAVLHLGDHVQKNVRAGGISEEEVNRISEAIDSLNALLDVEEPFTWILRDPQGISELKPMDGVHDSELTLEDMEASS